MFPEQNHPDQSIPTGGVAAAAAIIPQPLRVLMVEDSALDCELVVHELRNSGFAPDWQRIETEAGFRAGLLTAPDLVISDFQMPRFNGLRALELLQQSGLDIPFILVSGTIGEDTAVAAMRKGAADYLLKDRLARLGTAVANALSEGRLRRERQRMEQARIDQVEFVRDVLNSLTSAVVVLDEFGNISATNELWQRSERENGLGDNARWNYLTVCDTSWRSSGNTDAQAAADGIRRVLAGGTAEFSLEYPCHSPNRRRWFLMRVTPLGGAKRGAVVAHEDITERKLSEEALQRQKTELRVLFDYLPAMICFKSTNNVILRANQRLAATVGKTVAEIEGKPAVEIFTRDGDKHFAADLEVIQSGLPRLGIIESMPDAAGRSITIQTDKVPVCDSQGNVVGLILMSEDITERNRAAAQLLESRQRLALAIESAQLGIWDWEVAENILVWDAQMYALYGIREQDFSGAYLAWQEALHPDDRARSDAAFAAALVGPGGFHIEFRIVRPGGEVRDIEARANVMRAADGSPLRVTGVNRDVTDRRRMENTLRQSEEHFRRLIENSSDVIIVLTGAGVIQYHSPSLLRILGYQTEEVLGQVVTQFIHLEDRAKAAQGILLALSDALISVPVEYRIRHRDGKWRSFQSIGRAMDNSLGEKMVVVNSRDVTEMRKLELQFLRAQRLEAIGTLSSGIAHDLNNILAPTLMIAPMLLEKMRDPQDIELLTMIEQGAQRGANIIKQLLTFSRGVDGERGPVQAGYLLKEMVSLIRETFPRDLGLSESIPTNLWPIKADATQIHQVLLNLCVNARDAMPAGGKISLSAGNVILDEAATAPHPEAKPGEFVRITIADTGEGISNEHLDRIFEPFFTTKELGKGTGLGLSTVLGIVKSHGGFVTVYSEPGLGSTFNIHLPALAGTIATVADSVTRPKAGNRELILVVDDEASIRRTLSLALEKENFRVLVAADSREALILFQANRASIRLLLTDLMMPGINGVALIRLLRAQAPRLRVIAASGLHDEQRRAELATLEVTSILSKPFRTEEVLKAVQRELAAAT